ncbi:MAG: hypothetical protein OHK93_004677 [Ramalina farinacea]|uniref:Uncharacterized protein n=1 Tax=Ramalina farinacea TaxID=258253 RepID=A0AA43QWB8_9LECA|nr:hypothetical protein [Ramalina farinacea]
MKPSTAISLLPLLAKIGTLAAPQADRLNDLTRRKTTGRVPSATDFSCEADLTWITSCQSKTAAYSCFLAIQQVCGSVATDRQHTAVGGPGSSGTCTANVAMNNATTLVYDDCFNALQAINDGCVSPGERPDPHDNLPTMRGWQNTDPGNEKCGSNVDPNFPSYELASGNCVGKWGGGCGGQNRFGDYVSVANGGDGSGGIAPGGSHGAMPATPGAGARGGQYGNVAIP